uniref:G-protein coupled receptors family 1 profile domain-containing protein n=1 Tax=Bos mutus grunniens TaxID=30521 RepID=A0A8C0A9M7_BOSMU
MTENQTWVTEFILLGFPLSPSMQMLLFGLFSLFYVLTLLGNGVILGLISLDPRLHTPMYFFLSHLAIVDISYASNNVPKMLVNLLNKKNTISFVPLPSLCTCPPSPATLRSSRRSFPCFTVFSTPC